MVVAGSTTILLITYVSASRARNGKSQSKRKVTNKGPESN